MLPGVILVLTCTYRHTLSLFPISPDHNPSELGQLIELIGTIDEQIGTWPTFHELVPNHPVGKGRSINTVCAVTLPSYLVLLCAKYTVLNS